MQDKHPKTTDQLTVSRGPIQLNDDEMHRAAKENAAQLKRVMNTEYFATPAAVQEHNHTNLLEVHKRLPSFHIATQKDKQRRKEIETALQQQSNEIVATARKPKSTERHRYAISSLQPQKPQFTLLLTSWVYEQNEQQQQRQQSSAHLECCIQNATHLAQKLLLNSSSSTTQHHSSLPQLSSAGDASKKHRQQPTQSGKFPCTEPNCGKQFSSNADLKRYLRTHSNAKPFSCTYSGCSLEFNRRKNAFRHILNVHLKKKPADADKIEGEKGNNKPPEPATYLSVKEELL